MGRLSSDTTTLQEAGAALRVVDGIGHLAEVAIGVGDAFDQLERDFVSALQGRS